MILGISFFYRLSKFLMLGLAPPPLPSPPPTSFNLLLTSLRKGTHSVFPLLAHMMSVEVNYNKIINKNMQMSAYVIKQL